MTMTIDPPIFPERIKLRDTKVFADEGQRILTNATGYGYERQEYVRADLYETLKARMLVLLRPIDMQDVRLAAGEGVLTNADILAGVNAELRRRLSGYGIKDT